MRINVYRDRAEQARLFGKPVLFTEQNIPHETVADNWCCYDLGGNDRNPHTSTELMDRVLLRPAFHEEAGLFYSQMNQDQAQKMGGMTFHALCVSVESRFRLA